MSHESTDAVLARFETEYMAPNSISPPRRTEQLRVLRRFAQTLDGRSLAELTAADVQIFMGAEIARGLKPNTVRKEHIMIRAFVTWATAATLIDSERSGQLKSVRNPRGSTAASVPNPYKAAEIIAFKEALAAKYPALPTSGRGSHALKRWCAGRVNRLSRHLWRHTVRVQLELQVALALELGLRKVEILSLTIPALHYDNDEVVVLTAKQGPGQEVRRVVPYTAHARQCAHEWLELRSLLLPDHNEPWLFLRYGGSRDVQMAPLPMWKMTDALKPIPGPWRWHRFRHTAATEWLRAGMPVEKVRVMMGHATLEQTLMYTQIVQSDLGKAMGASEADFAKRLGIAA